MESIALNDEILPQEAEEGVKMEPSKFVPTVGEGAQSYASMITYIEQFSIVTMHTLTWSVHDTYNYLSENTYM